MKNVSFLIIILVLSLTGCGPSESDAATMTASAWTATPLPTSTPTLTPVPTSTPTDTPTPTPTPVPFDLTISIQDTEGSPLFWAMVNLPDSEETFTPDEAGIISWFDLPQADISFSVMAQGYLTQEVSATIERGANELAITMERDPFGLMGAEACLPTENLVYLDDFQDGEAQGWDALQFNLPGWSIQEMEAGNLVMSSSESGSSAMLMDQRFENAVWRLNFMYMGGANPNFEWRVSEDSKYEIGIITADIGGGAAHRFQAGSSVQVGGWNYHPFINEWYLLEISYFDNVLNVFVNGRQIMSPYQEAQPWNAGTIGITPFMNPDSQILLDDFIVCELTAPFETSYSSSE